jgi:transcriptional regulator with XRE-family HTH domain
MEKFLSVFGKRIKEERKNLGLTQNELAEKAGITDNYLSYIEAGKKSASLTTIKHIADALHVHISKLFQDITSHDSSKDDYIVRQIQYLVQDKDSSTKKLILNVSKIIAKSQDD